MLGFQLTMTITDVLPTMRQDGVEYFDAPSDSSRMVGRSAYAWANVKRLDCSESRDVV